MELSDWELVQKCQSGEMSAFQELVSRYHQKVFMVILGLLRNRDDALEVSQETFLRAAHAVGQGGEARLALAAIVQRQAFHAPPRGQAHGLVRPHGEQRVFLALPLHAHHAFAGSGA